jgi:L-arabinose isomerase
MSAKPLGQHEIWFVPGSHALYGDAALAQVDADAREVAGALDQAAEIPVRVVCKPVVISAEAIRAVCAEANAADSCVGVVVWMHTFSPAKTWIAGLSALAKPLLHLHTQFRAELPWAEIDMDYMNLHQSAHGDREFGFIATRMGLARKTVVGHWGASS